jgi:molybdopterin-guanine dinucleotide biosynthesis protein B
MIPVVSFVGKSNTGKTTLIEKLIVELKDRGFKVATVKFTNHKFDPDEEGKDTWRHTKAGAAATALVTPEKTAVFIPGDRLNIDELIFNCFTHSDILLVEGGKERRTPKFCMLDSVEDRPECPAEELLATVGDHNRPGPVPHFKRDDIKGIADMIQEKFLKRFSRGGVRVWIDGEPLEMKPFVQGFVRQTIRGMLSSLKGAKNGRHIQIKIGTSDEYAQASGPDAE